MINRGAKILILFALAAIASVLGCTNKNLDVDINSQFSIATPASGTVYADSSSPTIALKGYCSEATNEVLIIEPIRQLVPCSNGQWNFDLDMNIVPEGQFELRIGTPDESKSYSRIVTKKFYPSYLNISRPERNLSSASYLTHTQANGSNHALVYVSDEACRLSDCPTQNVVLRLRSENYLKPYFVTRDLYIESISPSIAVLPNGDFRIFYLTSETPTGTKSLYYRDFFIRSKTASEATLLVQTPSEFKIFQKDNGDVHLFYLSKEYCDLNGCAANKLAWRSSVDNYQSVTFPMSSPVNQCALSSMRVAHQSSNDTFHFAYRLSDSGTCDVATTETEYLKYNGTAWTSRRYATTHVGASELAVTNGGVAFYFFRTTWSNPCTTWSLMYRTSSDNFASQTEVPSSCPHTLSYPGDDHKPHIVNGNDGHLYLITHVYINPTSPRYSLKVSSSQDGFTSATTILPSDFSGSNSWPFLIKLTNGFEVFTVQGSGTDAGVIRAIVQNGVQTLRISLTGSPTGSIVPIKTVSNSVALIGTSNSWCTANGCNNLNYYVEDPFTGTLNWLTKIQQDGLELSQPHFARKPNGDEFFFYGSNEHSPLEFNTAIRQGADGFTTRRNLLAVNGSTSSSITGVTVDPSGTIHIAGWHGGDMIYTNSSDDYLTRTKVNSAAQGTARVLIRARDDGHIALIQATNGTGSWSDRLHSTVGNLTTELFRFPDSTSRYRGKTLTWSPSNSIETYALVDNNADGRRDIVRYSSANAYSPETIVSFPTKSMCYSSSKTKQIAAEYDEQGRLYVLYSASNDGSNTCILYMKRSDNWSLTWRLSHNDIIGYEPIDIFIRPGLKPLACARSLFSIHCFDTELVQPTTD